MTVYITIVISTLCYLTQNYPGYTTLKFNIYVVDYPYKKTNVQRTRKVICQTLSTGDF